MTSIYDKIFGKVGKGNKFTDDDKIGGGYNAVSLESSMKKFRNILHGGLAGKNLSKENADYITSIIEPHLKRLPLGGRLSYSTKLSIKAKFWQAVVAGTLSREDYEDAKKIVDLF